MASITQFLYELKGKLPFNNKEKDIRNAVVQIVSDIEHGGDLNADIESVAQRLDIEPRVLAGYIYFELMTKGAEHLKLTDSIFYQNMVEGTDLITKQKQFSIQYGLPTPFGHLEDYEEAKTRFLEAKSVAQSTGLGKTEEKMAQKQIERIEARRQLKDDAIELVESFENSAEVVSWKAIDEEARSLRGKVDIRSKISNSGLLDGNLAEKPFEGAPQNEREAFFRKLEERKQKVPDNLRKRLEEYFERFSQLTNSPESIEKDLETLEKFEL